MQGGKNQKADCFFFLFFVPASDFLSDSLQLLFMSTEMQREEQAVSRDHMASTFNVNRRVFKATRCSFSALKRYFQDHFL